MKLYAWGVYVALVFSLMALLGWEELLDEPD